MDPREGRDGHDALEARALHANVIIHRRSVALSNVWSSAMVEEFDPNAPPPSAEELRKALLQKEMERIEGERRAREAAEKKLADFTTDFLHNHVSDEEIGMVRRLVMNAVQDGKLEAMVYSFPSDLCSDGGRAINSNSPDWPETLQGKALDFYQRYEEYGRPRGYRLKAMVINFPGGMPGDIGFFLNWAPQEA
jgi:hypothetical protein